MGPINLSLLIILCLTVVRGFLARRRYARLRREAARQADDLQMLMAAVENWSEITSDNMRKIQEMDKSKPAGLYFLLPVNFIGCL